VISNTCEFAGKTPFKGSINIPQDTISVLNAAVAFAVVAS
jgi:hypothetical protein